MIRNAHPPRLSQPLRRRRDGSGNRAAVLSLVLAVLLALAALGAAGALLAGA